MYINVCSLAGNPRKTSVEHIKGKQRKHATATPENCI